MARPRHTLLGLALLLSATALAGVVIFEPAKLFGTTPIVGLLGSGFRPTTRLGGRPPVHRPAPRPSTLRGPIYALHAVTLDGQEQEIPIQAGMDLADPLPVDADAVELLIELNGPVLLDEPLKDGGRILTRCAPTTLRVVLEDPDDAGERGAVRLTLSEAPADPCALEDRLLAVGW